jgi:hypothetical protein
MKKAPCSKNHASAVKHMEKASHHTEKAKHFMEKAAKESMKNKADEKPTRMKRKK